MWIIHNEAKSHQRHYCCFCSCVLNSSSSSSSSFFHSPQLFLADAAAYATRMLAGGRRLYRGDWALD
jgi:hypothetical protein